MSGGGSPLRRLLSLPGKADFQFRIQLDFYLGALVKTFLLTSAVNTPYRISSVGRWCNRKGSIRLETRRCHACNTSVARLISVIQFTFDPRLSQPLDYMDSCVPSIKVSLLWRLSIVVRAHRMANNTKWHSEKTSTSCDRHLTP